MTIERVCQIVPANVVTFFILGAVVLAGIGWQLTSGTVRPPRRGEIRADSMLAPDPEPQTGAAPTGGLHFDVYGQGILAHCVTVDARTIRLGVDKNHHVVVCGPSVPMGPEERVLATIDARVPGSPVLIASDREEGIGLNGALVRRATLSHGDVIAVDEARVTIGLGEDPPR